MPVASEVVLYRVKPSPGMRAQDVEFPGPGTFEAVFDLPAWIPGGPGLDIDRSFEFTVSAYRVRHIRSRFDFAEGAYLVKVHIERDNRKHDPEQDAVGSGLTLGGVMRGLREYGQTWGLENLLQVLIDNVREIRVLLDVRPQVLGLVVVGSLLVLAR